MREIIFYRTENKRCPVEEFLDTLSDKQVEKILWVFTNYQRTGNGSKAILQEINEYG